MRKSELLTIFGPFLAALNTNYNLQLVRHFELNEHQMIEKTVTKCKNLCQLHQIHAHFIKLNLFHDPNAVVSFLSFAATSTNPNFLSYVTSLLHKFHPKTTFLYNNLIKCHVQCNSPIPAFLSYKDMLQCRIIKNNYTFTPLVKACSMLVQENKDLGCLVHCHVLKIGLCDDTFIGNALIEFYGTNFEMGCAQKVFDEMPVKDVVLWTSLVDGYGKMGEIGKAREMFDEMPVRNVVSWSAMMAGYSRVSDFREVLCLFKRMEETGLKGNESVLASVVTACGNLGAVGQGLWVHSYARRCGYVEDNTLLGTALVDMYSKGGYVDFALEVFKEIKEKDTGAWNAIISGMAMNCDVKKSLELFDEMVVSGTQPTEATFVSILTACTHANLVDVGISLFEKMHEFYKIKPTGEHFACVVDLLARSGRIDEAETFIDEKMRGVVELDAYVWGSLLGACRVYRKIDIGNRVWRKLAEKGVVDYGTHVLAYNLYKEAGWDDEAQNVRRLIEKKQVKKKPGCSAIEVNGIVEEFLAGNNKSHPQSEEIFKLLNSLLSVDPQPITWHEYV